jgi:hypothetical protein
MSLKILLLARRVLSLHGATNGTLVPASPSEDDPFPARSLTAELGGAAVA